MQEGPGRNELVCVRERVCVMAPSGAGSDEALGTSDRDYGEHKGDMEGSMRESGGWGKAMVGTSEESEKERAAGGAAAAS